MAYYSGFQSNAFQLTGYQIIPSGANNDVPIDGGGKTYDNYSGYNTHRAQQLAEEKRQNAILLKQKEEEIARIEAQRLEDFFGQQLQQQLMSEIIQYNALEAERKRLEHLWLRLLQDDEDIFIILMSMPFMN